MFFHDFSLIFASINSQMLLFNKFCGHFFPYSSDFFFFFGYIFRSQVCKLKTTFIEALLVSRNGFSLIKCRDEKLRKQSNYSLVLNLTHFALNDVFKVFVYV